MAELGQDRFPNSERRLRPLEEIVSIYAGSPAAVFRTAEVADRCSFSLDELRYEYPEEFAPLVRRLTPTSTRLAWAGAQSDIRPAFRPR